MKIKDSILVVDDDLDFQVIIRQILEKKGFKVNAVSTGKEAMALLNDNFYNVAILDISLPDTEGTELLSQMVELHPEIIAIMLTGHSSVKNAVLSLNSGAFSYLEKPLDPDNLLSIIQRGLEKQHLVFENRKLISELERHNRTATTLLSVAQAVAQSLDLQKIIDSALERVAECTGLEAFFIYLRDRDKLKFRGHHGLPPRAMVTMPQELAVTSGIFIHLLEQSGPIIIKDLEKTDELELEFLKNFGYRSFAAVPLTILGENIGVLGIATDFTQSFSPNNLELLTGIGREIAIAVRNAQLYEDASSARALRELDTMRTEFLANVSHELRTPLAVIKGSANSLLQPDVIFDEQTRREFLVSIDRDADTLTRLVDDLLMVSRLDANALEVKKQAHKMGEVIDYIKDRLHKLTIKRHLSIDIPDDLPPVNIDEVRIGEVLTNLVENAVKFSDDDSRIIIRAAKKNNEVIITVADEGIGIPAELQQKIFERFFQAEGRNKSGRRGTGLGLAICKGIIQAHEGRIWVDSKPGQGAEFSFSLPVN
ncbi:MAG: ATP-binding protein [Dehalococcoidales bacterium]|nr:ATP-binding protein [Dehalococcoidales bacterium]